VDIVVMQAIRRKVRISSGVHVVIAHAIQRKVRISSVVCSGLATVSGWLVDWTLSVEALIMRGGCAPGVDSPAYVASCNGTVILKPSLCDMSKDPNVLDPPASPLTSS
jgi:hypothetical protein